MVTTIMDANNAVVSPQLTAYRYDQLNRIKQMFAYQSLTANSWNNAQTNAYAETYRYDANGNIDSLSRRDATQQEFDNLKYNYNVAVANTNPTLRQLSNNRLAGVTQQNAATITDKFKTSYYDYDAIGNLIKDSIGDISNIKWNVYGKISKITKTIGDDIEFMYDATGNRICKKVIPKGYDPPVYTFYARDAQGNIMATYITNYMQPVGLPGYYETYLNELDIYGSSRIGIKSLYEYMGGALGTQYKYNRILGSKRYEIANHLGNVITTFTDQKKYLASGTDITGYSARLISTQDYYPFGMQMTGRSFNSSNYRFGFNGKEKDKETYGEGNEYDFGARIYNPRIGRWLSLDPLAAKYPNLTPYNFVANNPLIFIDPDGKDPREAGKVLNINGRKFDIIRTQTLLSHTSFSKKINDKEMWNKFDDVAFMSTAASSLISKSEIASTILEKITPGYQAKVDKLDRFLDACVSDKYQMLEIVDKDNFIEREVKNMGKGFESEVSIKTEYTRNTNGDFEVSKITQYEVVKNKDYGKKKGQLTNSEYLYRISSYEFNGTEMKKNVEHKPATKRENTN